LKNHSPGDVRKELLDSLTAIAIFAAIACLVVVHRAILTGLLTARLVCCETDCADHSCQNRKQDFEILFHDQPSLASIAKASQKNDNLAAAATLQDRGEVCYGYRLPLEL
jgi:hypothetical protein